MSKTIEKPEELVEADFKKIQKLIQEKYRKKYTLSYIRKVCKGKRKSEMIKQMAEQYLILLKELENKIEKLSK